MDDSRSRPLVVTFELRVAPLSVAVATGMRAPCPDTQDLDLNK